MENFINQTQFRNFYGGKKINSQNGQDYLVAEYFNFKKNGVFIDIGANDGFTLSNTFYLEKELQWNGICIEAIPKTFAKLDKNRNCIKINAGISDQNSKEIFVYMEPSSMMLSGMLKEYHPKHFERIKKQMEESGSRLIEVEIDCVTITSVLEKHDIFSIDYLNIDTEGNEFKILKSIDFDKYDIKLMTVENNYKDKNQTDYIKSKGYKMIGTLGGDEVFVKI